MAHTPVIWRPEQLKSHVYLLPISPFFDLLDIVRSPLLGATPTLMTWLGAALYSFVLCAISWALFARARGRIAFWL